MRLVITQASSFIHPYFNIDDLGTIQLRHCTLQEWLGADSKHGAYFDVQSM